ncbi:hypothetical protein GcC1_047039, partial [Golovinomyces cichoracearum]
VRQIFHLYLVAQLISVYHQYVDEDGVITSKWAAHLTLDNENHGLRTTSSTEAMHRLIKTYLGYGFGHLFRLYKCVNEAIKVTSRIYQEELGEQKMAVLAQYGGFKWIDKLPRRISKKVLRLLVHQHDKANKMLKGDIPPGNCAPKELCTCPIQLQEGIIYA